MIPLGFPYSPPGSKPGVRQAMDDAHVTGQRLAGREAQGAQPRAIAQAKADADLLDEIRAAGPGGTWCRWCSVRFLDAATVRHRPGCLWLRIKARP